MSAEAGYIGLEVSQLTLNYKIAPSGDLPLKFEAVIRTSNPADNFLTWRSSSSPTLTSSQLNAYKLENDANVSESTEPAAEGEEGPAPKNIYTVDFNYYEKSSFIELKSEVISRFASASVDIRVIAPGGGPAAAAAAPAAAAAAPAAKGAKAPAAAAPVAAAPTASENVLFEFSIPFRGLIDSVGAVIESPVSLSEENSSSLFTIRNVSEAISAFDSSFSVRLVCDNDLAEYLMGGATMYWDTAKLLTVPRQWGLHVADTPDPAAAKAKVPPTEAELKAKYLDALNATLNANGDCAFTISIKPVDAELLPLPAIDAWRGAIHFNKEGIDSLSLEDIKNRSDLWSISWQNSPAFFFNRSVLRALGTALSDPSNSELIVEVKKTPSDAVSALEGGPLSASGKISLAALGEPEMTSLSDLAVEVTESGSDAAFPLTLSVKLSRPLTLSADINSAVERSHKRPLDVSLLHQISGGTNNRDVFKELREDISKVIKEVATEYVALYPAPPTENGESTNDMEQRKIHFLHHLTTNGIYHRLKESIKPRIQRAARKRYGVRSRALGLAGSANFDSMAIGSETEVPLDQLVGEFYVFLVQECNFVLNAMYRETVVACDISELEKPPAIDDELESPKQLFRRLLSLALDAEAAKDFSKAEQRHLERIQLLTIEKIFTGDYSSIRNAYSEYAQFLMHRAAFEGRNGDTESRDASLASAREALLVALAADTGDLESDWDLQLQLGCLLLEVGQHEAAIEYIQLSIEAQTQPVVPLSAENFDGYESDKICPVFPLCHIFASIYYLEQNKPLTARKATRLAVRSYAESNSYPTYETHGKPKRTATVAYTMAALYAFTRGFSRVGKLCVKWAKECDDAATQKADARNLPTNAAPVVRFLTKKAECTAYLDSRNFESAIQSARDCVNTAPDSFYEVDGYVCVLKALVEAGGDSKGIYDAFMQALKAAAVEATSDNDQYRALPLWAYIEVGKSLMAVGNYSEAVTLLLLGCSVYVSSTLFLMIGISCLRLERYQDAEDALEEANMIDNRNAQVWGYLTILCMNGGDSRRLHEGSRCLQQVLRLGVSGPEAPGLLREIAMSQIAVDRLNAAEDLLRRAIAIESQISASGKANPYSRKLLADVLMGQNSLVVAVEEYQRVIEDADADPLMRLDACDKCISVLASLGRDEEIRSVSIIQDALRSGGR